MTLNTQVCGSDDTFHDSRVSGLSLSADRFWHLLTENVMAAKDDSEEEQRESIVRIELTEPSAEQECERPLLDNVTQLEGI
jgi:hypothetical protein